jgi:hypothetical protein
MHPDHAVGLPHEPHLGIVRHPDPDVGGSELVALHGVAAPLRALESEDVGFDLHASRIDREGAFRRIGPVGRHVAQEALRRGIEQGIRALVGGHGIACACREGGCAGKPS